MDWLRKRIRKWRRARAARHQGPGLPAFTGRLVITACHASAGSMSPVLRSVLRPSLHYRGMDDTEIRGYLDGSVKFRRNVATQYHVRIGCEASKPERGRYEVMRVLHVWDLSALQQGARVRSARIIL